MLFLLLPALSSCVLAIVLSLHHPNIETLSTLYLEDDGEYVLAKRQSPLSLNNKAACYTAQFNISGSVFNMSIDSGSSDMAVPYAGLNDYEGITLSVPLTDTTPQVYAIYGDASGWIGYGKNLSVGIPSTNSSAVAPVFLMLNQTKNPAFVDGLSNANGLTGIAFASKSVLPYGTPATVLDAWYQAGVIPRNEVAIHGCSGTTSEQSFIDFGNTAPYLPCNGGVCPKALVNITDPSLFNVYIEEIAIGGKAISLPLTFQNTSQSALDSCTTVTILPEAVVVALQDAIISSNGLSSSFISNQYFDSFFDGSRRIGTKKIDPTASFLVADWSLLPNISFSLKAQQPGYSRVSLVLGPRQYIQVDPTGYFWSFTIQSDVAAMGASIDYALLGLPFFNAFHIVLDRTNYQIGFQPGCGCNSSLDKYPNIITDSDADVSKTWSCQGYTELIKANQTDNTNENVAFEAHFVSSYLVVVLIMAQMFIS